MLLRGVGFSVVRCHAPRVYNVDKATHYTQMRLDHAEVWPNPSSERERDFVFAFTKEREREEYIYIALIYKLR